MTAAVLTIIVASGFWPGGHWERRAFESVTACEEARPRIEAEKRALGQVVTMMVCNTMKEDGR